MTEVPFLDLRRLQRELAPHLDEALSRVVRSGRYILGLEVERFERRWAEYCRVDHCVGVGNGLNALELVLRAWNIGESDEVIVPSNTYIAGWLAVTNVGARPVPVEPDLRTFNLNPALVEASITPRTRALMPVHLYGQCADMDALMAVAEDHGLKVLEDAAQGHGAEIAGERAGALGHAAAFSFYPTKNLGAFGDAGAVTTADPELAERVRLLRNYGSGRKYYNEVVGTNSRLDEFQAALLDVVLDRLDDLNGRRAEHARVYSDAFAGIPGLQLPFVPTDHRPVWHVYSIHHPERDKLRAALKGSGIETLIFYPVPPHLSDAYRTLGWRAGSLPVAEHLAGTNLGLPISPQLTEAERTRVIDAMHEATSLLSA